jgi:hypothetical protein
VLQVPPAVQALERVAVDGDTGVVVRCDVPQILEGAHACLQMRDIICINTCMQQLTAGLMCAAQPVVECS